MAGVSRFSHDAEQVQGFLINKIFGQIYLLLMFLKQTWKLS